MYFSFQQRYNLLTVGDDFAHLDSVDQFGNLIFKFFYTVSLSDVVSKNATTVNVTVSSRNVVAQPLLVPVQLGYVNTSQLVRNILTQVSSVMTANRQQQQYIVAYRQSDIMASINNEILGQLQAQVPSNNIQQLNQSSLQVVYASDVTVNAEDKPVLTMIAHDAVADIDNVHSASLAELPQTLSHDMIFRQGIDPSVVTSLTPRSISAIDSVGGILRPSNQQEIEFSLESRLLNYYLFPAVAQNRPSLVSQVQGSDQVQVLSSQVEDTVEVPVLITIPRSALSLNGQQISNFFVKFDLVDGRTGIAIDTVLKVLDVTRHTQLYYTPLLAPKVKVSSSDTSTHANLEINLVEPGVTAVQVYKKNFFRAVVDVDDYTLIGTYDVTQRRALTVRVDMPIASPIIYRVIPVGRQGTIGFEFTNVVIKPNHFSASKAISLVAQPIDIGVRLEVRHIPRSVVAIELKSRNNTIFQKEFQNVGGDVILIDDSVRESDYLTVVDSNVTPGNIYEYVAKLIYKSGDTELAGNASIELLRPTPDKVDTKIDNVQVDQSNQPNVTFTVSTSIVDSNLEIVKALMQRQDILAQFSNDIQRERDFLNSLIGHLVHRVNLTSGVRENFGVITTTTFSDRDLSKNQAIEPLKLGNKYRYEVTALLRAPETMFRSLIKETIDPVTKKTYIFNPAKFLHPLALEQGILVSELGLETRFAKDPMSHGAVASVQTVEVSFDVDPTHISNPAVARFDRFNHVITWKLDGDINLIDHFLIIKDDQGVRTVVGKSHSEFPFGNCQYVHPLTRQDAGAYSYVIVPVYNDYKSGTEALTNVVIV